MEKCLFSVVIPAYNVAPYIRECVESVLASAEGADDVEIIIVDDGSTDETGRMADEMANAASCVRVVHQINQGLSMARNAGIDAAEGEYIVYVDGDDTIAKDELPNIRKCIEDNNKPDLVMIKYETVDEEGHTAKQLTGENFDRLKELSVLQIAKKICYYNAVWLYCMKTKLLKDNDLKMEKGLLPEDEEFTPRVVFAAKSIALCNSYCYRYRIGRLGSTVNTKGINLAISSARITVMLWHKFHEGAEIGLYDGGTLQAAEDFVMNFYIKQCVLCAQRYKHDAKYKDLLEALRLSAVVLVNSEEKMHKRYLYLIKSLGMQKGVKAFCVYNKAMSLPKLAHKKLANYAHRILRQKEKCQ